ncbi:2348_t:CDS:2, partial [Racocetra persica]
MSEDFEDFVSTHEALKTIFPQASNEEITKYEKQLSSVKILDPVLIISPNQAWINQQGVEMRILVVFHFATNTELYTVRDNIHALFPNAFFVPTSLQAQIPNAQLHPVGTAWILTKVGVRDSDFGKDTRFFLIN